MDLLAQRFADAKVTFFGRCPYRRLRIFDISRENAGLGAPALRGPLREDPKDLADFLRCSQPCHQLIRCWPGPNLRALRI
jgi:hypothetical protein